MPGSGSSGLAPDRRHSSMVAPAPTTRRRASCGSAAPSQWASRCDKRLLHHPGESDQVAVDPEDQEAAPLLREVAVEIVTDGDRMDAVVAELSQECREGVEFIDRGPSTRYPTEDLCHPSLDLGCRAVRDRLCEAARIAEAPCCRVPGRLADHAEK